MAGAIEQYIQLQRNELFLLLPRNLKNKLGTILLHRQADEACAVCVAEREWGNFFKCHGPKRRRAPSKVFSGQKFLRVVFFGIKDFYLCFDFACRKDRCVRSEAGLNARLTIRGETRKDICITGSMV